MKGRSMALRGQRNEQMVLYLPAMKVFHKTGWGGATEVIIDGVGEPTQGRTIAREPRVFW